MKKLFLIPLVIIVVCGLILGGCGEPEASTPPNQPPVITSLAASPPAVGPGGTSTVNCVASDPDGDPLSYSWSATGGSISGVGHRVTWAAPSATGSYTITVSVKDGEGGVATGTSVVSVLTAPNKPPVITSLAASPPAVGPGESSTVNCVASDPDGDPLGYSWSATGGSISGVGHQVTWAAPSAGSYTIAVTVDDGKGGVVTQTFVVSVLTAPNQPPIIIGLAASPPAVRIGESLTVTCVADDPDGDPLGYSWAPTGGSISGVGPQVTWTAPSTLGSYAIVVTVYDGKGGEAVAGCEVIVRTNQPPVIASVTADPATVVLAGTSTITCVADDPEGDSLLYTWSKTGGSFTSIVGNKATWKAPKTSGDYTITVTVDDGEGGVDTETCVITVIPILTIPPILLNKPPVITSVTADPATVFLAGTSTITCIASDPEGGSLTYTWGKTGGGFTSIAGNKATWKAPKTAGTYTITVTVRDNKGAEVTGWCTVTVKGLTLPF